MTASLGVAIGQPVLGRPEVALYLCLTMLLAVGAVAPVNRLLEAMGWRDPAKRLLAAWAVQGTLAGLFVLRAVLTAVEGLGGAQLGRLPWAFMLLALAGAALVVAGLRVGDRRPEG